jgi:predicted dehydrogenase
VTPIRIAVVGLGKIARDQHLPVIAASDAFELVAGITPSSTLDGVPCFRSLDAYLQAGPEADAVAMCQPPQVRADATLAAIAAGRHVLLEKPPAASLSEVEALTAAAAAAGVTLFAAWHSRFAAAVAPARAWLAGRRVTGATIRWKEDVRRWHPGQQWIWEPGGLGVFDPGINALSIATAILPEPLRLEDAVLEMPANRAAPIAATLALRSGDAVVRAEFDWRQEGPQSWDITIETADGRLDLAEGGARWFLDGQEQASGDEGEYPALYRHFAELVRAKRSDVDPAPLRLVADAFLRGRLNLTEAFHD